MTKEFVLGKYDVIVVGAGHAGCEASLAAARMGENTLLLSIHLESIAMMPCNPSIGGTGKGHLVREIDALGGEMGINIDKTYIQSKMLNTAKGPAVHSLRAQADKNRYHSEMKMVIEDQENLDVKQGEVVDIIIKDGKVTGVIMKTGAIYHGESIIFATGTYLKGKIFMGEANYYSGPNGLAPSIDLSDNLKEKDIKLRRFKTGTPARVDKKTLDFSKMEEQKGDEVVVPFSFMNDELNKEQEPCWLTYTNKKTHDVIRANFSRSALFGGQIEGVGPRYCPSIEDKISRFADKGRHQLFVEPEGLETCEMYVQGMSTSLPEDVQEAFYKTIPGLEDVKIIRPAYAIEYDCIDPLDLKLSLEYRYIENLFFAGQINGSSGYEEAAAQGLMAGINAALNNKNKEPFILDRSEAYIGVLIDDLVTKGTEEPYRIMTSRAEYRLILRQDNADVRLTEKAYNLGLVKEDRYKKFVLKREVVKIELERLETKTFGPKDLNEYLGKIGSTILNNKVKAIDLLKRPEIKYVELMKHDDEATLTDRNIIQQIEIFVKYTGYIDKQLKQIEKFKKLEGKKLDKDFDYNLVEGLRIEANQKLNSFKPLSVGQASRISGVSPADINVLLIHLEKERRQNEK